MKNHTPLRIALGLVLVSAGAGAATLLQRFADTKASSGNAQMSATLSSLVRRLDEIEASIHHFRSENRSERSTEARSSMSPNTHLDRRITAIENALSEVLNREVAHQDPEPSEMEHGLDPTYVNPVPIRVETMPITHAGETGVSPWGEQVAVGIESQYSSDPFFGRFGGELSTDCRQTTCKLTWFMPPAENMAPGELDLVQSMAHYELATLAAAEGRGIGQFEVEWDTTGATPHVAVYLSRTE